jgi:hypothetical protein
MIEIKIFQNGNPIEIDVEKDFASDIYLVIQRMAKYRNIDIGITADTLEPVLPPELPVPVKQSTRSDEDHSVPFEDEDILNYFYINHNLNDNEIGATVSSRMEQSESGWNLVSNKTKRVLKKFIEKPTPSSPGGK